MSGRVLRYDDRLAAPESMPSPLKAVTTLYSAWDGAVWAGGEALVRYEDETEPKIYSEGIMLRGERVVAICEPSADLADSDSVWIATNKRLLRWSAGEGVVVVDNRARSCLFFDGGGHRWEILDGAELRVDGIERLQLDSDPGTCFGTMQLDESRTAIAFEGKVLIATYDSASPTLEPTRFQGATRAIHQAPHGAFWLGMEPDGLLLVRPSLYRIVDVPRQGHALDCVDSIDGESVLIGSNRDRRVWTIASNGESGEGVPSDLGAVAAFEALPNTGYPRVFVRDASGHQYFGTSEGLFQLADGEPVSVDPARPREVYSLVADDTGRLWASGSDKVVEYEGGARTGRNWTSGSGPFHQMILHKDLIYGCQGHQIFVLDIKTGSTRQVAEFPGGVVRSLYMDESEDLWVSTYGDGLHCRRSSGKMERWGLEDGLPDLFLGWVGVVPGPTESTHLWMSSNTGVIVASLQTPNGSHGGTTPALRFRLIQTPEANGRRGAALKDGTLALPTMAGVIVLDSRTTFTDPIPPRLGLQRTLLGGAPLDLTQKITGSADVEFHFSAALFPSSHSAIVEHRLLGHDDTWRSAGRAREVDYRKLGPGKYTFQVRARAPGSPISPVLSHPEVLVGKVWHQRNDTRLAGLLGALLLAAWAVQLRTRGLVKRSKALQEEVQRELAIKELRSRLAKAEEAERARIARELHDDFSQRLAAFGMALSAADDMELASMGPASEFQGVRLGIEELARDLHDLSRRLHPTVVDDLGLLRALRSECARRSALAKIPVEVDTLGDCTEAILGLDRDSALTLFRVAQEALLNAVRHGAPTHIWVRLGGDAEGVRLEIEDDGSGIVTDPKKRAGIGLASMRERMALIDGHLEIQSGPGEGTTVLARI